MQQKTVISYIPSFLKRWETLLVALIMVVFYYFYRGNPDIFTPFALLGNTQVYMDIGFQAMSMMLILMLGAIDISVGAISALSLTVMAICYNKGAGIPFLPAVMIALITGTACGALNGYLVICFKELFPMIITLATMTIYRGIAYILLEDQSSGNFPRWFSSIGYNTIPGTPIPINLVCFLVTAIIFYLFVHHTVTGRRILAIGTNLTASRFSGIRTDKIKFLLFTLNGTMAAIAGIFLAARTSSVRPNMALGYEMQAIAVVVLGGVSTAGGKGNVIGVILSLFLIGILKFGMKINNIDGQLEPMVVGLLLIMITLPPNILTDIRKYLSVKRQQTQLRRESSRDVPC